MAQQQVIADLAGINEEVKKLSATAREAAKQTKTISENLKFDANNVNLITERFKSMEKELKANKDLAEQYNSALAKLRERQTELSEIAKLTKLTADQREELTAVNQNIDKYEKLLDKAENSVRYLTAATQKEVQSQSTLRAATKSTQEKFEQLNKAATALSVTTLAIVGAFAKISQSAIEQGKQLYNLSVRYNTDAKEIQKWNIALERATGQSDLFTASLKRVIEGFASIAANRGKEYSEALNNIGLSYRELADRSTAEQFEAILDRFAEMTDATQRLAAARTLFGDEGVAIAQMFEREGFDLDRLKQEAEEYGLVSQQTAEGLADLSFELAKAKSQISLASAELTTALTPAILAIADIITNVFAPALKNIANWFSRISPAGQKILLFLAGALIILPKIIVFIGGLATAIKAIKESVTLLNIATSKWQIIFTAVSLVIIGIITLIGVFSSKAQDALDDVKKLQNASDSLVGAGEDYSSNIETVASSSTVQSIQIDATIEGRGDTPISDENATKVAQIMNDQLADAVNKAFGRMVK